MLTVRNRLAVTKKCIEALYKHSKHKFKIYVYDNCSNYKVEEHFAYFYHLYNKGFISQITFTSKDSTFNAFSKAVASNLFGLQHEQDPLKKNYDFLVILDNDIIVTPEWDSVLHEAWGMFRKSKNVKIIGQYPGGIKDVKLLPRKVSGKETYLGKLGGSGLWTMRPNFYSEVGYLNVQSLINHDKKHDQLYWAKMDRMNNGNPYIVGINKILAFHVSKFSGSVCNVLSKNRNDPNKDNLINFEDAEKKIENLTFEQFYNMIKNDKAVKNSW